MAARMDSTDWYAVLGVSPAASKAEVRKAYLARARQVHPDLDRARGPGSNRSWREANARAAEVNRAWEVLGDDERRREYDAARRVDAGPADSGFGRSHAPYGASRGHGRDPATANGSAPAHGADEQASVPGEGHRVGGGWAFFADLPRRAQKAVLHRQKGLAADQVRVRCAEPEPWARLFFAVALWAVVVAMSMEVRWTSGEADLLLFGTFLVAVYAARQCIALHRAWAAVLESWTYVTPLYVVTTSVDRVRFEPLWELTGFEQVPARGSGVDVVFRWGDRSLVVHASTRAQLESLVAAVAHFGAAIVDASRRRDFRWFQRHDDFAGASPDARATEPSTLSPGVRLGWYCATLVAGYLALVPVLDSNRSATAEPSYSAAGGASAAGAATVPGRVARVAPPRLPAPSLRVRPETGTATWLTLAERVAPFEIRTRGRDDYYVKLVDLETGRDVVMVYVRGGASVDLDVPLGTYALRYATGPAWYGHEHLFGSQTRYVAADEPFVFETVSTVDGWRLGGFTVTLHPVAGGDLSTKPMRPSDF